MLTKTHLMPGEKAPKDGGYLNTSTFDTYDVEKNEKMPPTPLPKQNYIWYRPIDPEAKTKERK
jgi:hypothetical protein